MNFKKILVAFLSAAIITGSGGITFADVREISEYESTEKIIPISAPVEIVPISASIEVSDHAYYNSFTGLVKGITDYKDVEGSIFVNLESKDGNEANMIISKDTYLVDDTKIEVGTEITGYYRADMPMILIYPAQYVVDVVSKTNQNIKVDMFNENLVSADNMLKLNISEDTQIILKDGSTFKGELSNRRLVVIYEVSTRSIPAQTNPIKVIVLDEVEYPSNNGPVQQDKEPLLFDVSTAEFIVDNKKIEATSAYTNEQGIVMVPLRAIAEVLGFEVSWDGETQSIMIGQDISLAIGKDDYSNAAITSIKLGTAPELVDSKTFVPLSFFREVVQMNNAYWFENQIVINNGEKME